MRELREGNIDALDGIYELTSKGVYILAYSILKNAEKAKDVMQDTFLRAAANIGQYKPGTNPKAWISVIARNAAYREYNNAKRIVCQDFSEHIIDKNVNETMWTDNIILNDALQTLTAQEREIVSLFAAQGYKHREIAQIVGRPIGTIQWLYNRAVKKMRKNTETKKHEE
ncbi:MAG: RNA polymerase sigma factor [Clostridiales bacterium]|nr:RNA polymerase sigma factor [Clostridiales bacterium]